VSEKKVLEINYEHPIYQKLQSLKNNKEELKKYLHILNAQGRLLVGLPVKNNNEIIKELLHLLAK